jgi:hypothetical protein
MLEPPITNLGAKGIRKAAVRIPDWPKMMSVEELREACFNSYIMIDAKGGSGGGLFRTMYGRFLDEAATITGDSRLAKGADEFKCLGKGWDRLAQWFLDVSKASDLTTRLGECRALLNALADQEETAWQRLWKFTGE